MPIEKEILLNAINDIRKKAKKMPDKDRIISHKLKKKLMNEDNTETVLDGLAKDGSIYLETYEDSTTAYFISKSYPDTQSCSMLTDLIAELQCRKDDDDFERLVADFQDFKEHSFKEISTLRVEFEKGQTDGSGEEMMDPQRKMDQLNEALAQSLHERFFL